MAFLVELINVYAINYVSSGIFFINILITLQFAKVFSVCVAKHLTENPFATEICFVSVSLLNSMLLLTFIDSDKFVSCSESYYM